MHNPFRNPFRNTVRRPWALILCLAPFLVAFDPPDSAGVYAKVSGGHGAYHITGCHRDFDQEFTEGQITMRHTFATGGDPASASLPSKLKPAYTTVGYFGDFTVEQLTVVKDTAKNGTLGNVLDTRGFAGGAYVGLDWRWVGLDLGFGGLAFNLGETDAERKQGFPMLGARVGLLDGLYASGELFGSNPFLSGGGAFNLGVGGKVRDTRAWIGVGGFGVNGSNALGILKIDQGWGPWMLSASILGNGKDVPPAGMGIDQEYGFSLGLAYRLSSLR